ncbi:hypothetical protein ACTQ4E_06925 [Lawsonibacter sp. LCP25S3_G6]|uniref:hypothetical protein n=1 Tax=unclassified Lawsonibacter TaxID=2617946 RepID=UPI003F9AEBC0
MRAVLLLWCGCALSITLSLVHFVWVATAAERILILALLVLAGLFALRGQR